MEKGNELEMAKIYPDTNRFIDFYRAALDRIDVLGALHANISSLVLTDVICQPWRDGFTISLTDA